MKVSMFCRQLEAREGVCRVVIGTAVEKNSRYSSALREGQAAMVAAKLNTELGPLGKRCICKGLNLRGSEGVERCGSAPQISSGIWAMTSSRFMCLRWFSKNSCIIHLIKSLSNYWGLRLALFFAVSSKSKARTISINLSSDGLPFEQ